MLKSIRAESFLSLRGIKVELGKPNTPLLRRGSRRDNSVGNNRRQAHY